MSENGDADLAPRASVMVATVIVSVAAVVVISRWDRAYQRWLTEISPLTGPRAGLQRFRTGFQGQRANVTEVGQVINDLLDQVSEGLSGRGRK